MKYFHAFLLALLMPLSLRAANPTFQNFDGTQFATPNNGAVIIKDGVKITNALANSLTITNTLVLAPSSQIVATNSGDRIFVGANGYMNIGDPDILTDGSILGFNTNSSIFASGGTWNFKDVRTIATDTNTVARFQDILNSTNTFGTAARSNATVFQGAGLATLKANNGSDFASPGTVKSNLEWGFRFAYPNILSQLRPYDVAWSTYNLALASATLQATMLYSNRPARIMTIGDSMADYGRQQFSIGTGFCDYLKAQSGDCGQAFYGWDTSFHPQIFRTAGRPEANTYFLFNDPAVMYASNGSNDQVRAYQGGYFGTAPVHNMPVNKFGLLIYGTPLGGTASFSLTNESGFVTNGTLTTVANPAAWIYTNWAVPLATNYCFTAIPLTGTNIILGPEFTVTNGQGVESFFYSLGGSTLNDLLHNGDAFLTNLFYLAQPDIVFYHGKYGNALGNPPWSSANLTALYNQQTQLFNDIEASGNTNVNVVDGVANVPIVVIGTPPTQSIGADVLQNSNQWQVVLSDANGRWSYADLSPYFPRWDRLYQNGWTDGGATHPKLAGQLSAGSELVHMMNLDMPVGYSANTYPQINVPGTTYLLDVNPNALAAYALFRLSGTYFGPLILVQRGSDGATNAIGFNAFGELDTNTLAFFLGGGSSSGRIAGWYDQSGNGNHAMQLTAAQQPIIWTNGVLVTNSMGKPAIQFPGTVTVNRLTTPSLTISGACAVYCVLQHTNWNISTAGSLFDIALSGSAHTGVGARASTSAGSTLGVALDGAIGGYGAGLDSGGSITPPKVFLNPTGLANNTAHFFNYQLGPSATAAWMDGSTANAVGAANGTIASTTAAMNIGYNAWASSQTPDAKISLLIIYGNTNSAAARASISGYITNYNASTLGYIFPSGRGAFIGNNSGSGTNTTFYGQTAFNGNITNANGTMAANQFVVTGAGTNFATTLNGSTLTSLNGANITAGTINSNKFDAGTLALLGIGGGAAPVIVFANADQTVVNSTTLVNATSLVVPVAANGKYRYRGWIPWDMGADPTAGGAFAFTFPASPNYWLTSAICHSTDSSSFLDAQDNTIGGTVVFTFQNGSLANSCVFTFEGYLDNGPNAGNIQLKFAQITANGTTITLKRGAYIELTKLN